MRIEWQIAPLDQWQADAVLFFVFEDSPDKLPGFKRWVEGQPFWADHLETLRDFQGKFQQTAVYYGPQELAVPRVLCVGLGSTEGFDMDKLRTAAATALRKCRELRLKRPTLPLLALEGIPLEPPEAFREALIGALLGLYRNEGLKTRDKEPIDSPDVLLLANDTEPPDMFLGALRYAEAISDGIYLTRDLVVAPANQVTPTSLLQTAQDLAAEHGFQLETIDFERAKKMGMGLFSAVAQGSREPAYVIILEHKPAGAEEDPPFVFIGKGITFDTGGISIKPSNKLELMKHDMAGAAAVIGTFEVLGKLQIKRRVIGIMPCTENMPDGKAYKPGDVLRSLSGLTVEVISTDAEGRLILADAITYALRYDPAVVVDIATLTGACIVALGDRVGAVMGNNDKLVSNLQEIGKVTGERLWPLPQWDFYFDDIKSDVADFKNVGDRKAGSIVGGIFLKQFVPESLPWVHLDVAGPVWSEKDLIVSTKGATGFGVRILTELAIRGIDLL